jgi:hypothetical protein
VTDRFTKLEIMFMFVGKNLVVDLYFKRLILLLLLPRTYSKNELCLLPRLIVHYICYFVCL